MDISDLHYFTAAADAGSFSSSGKALGRDPSTLSRRIEPDIGDDVHRLPVRYSLTGGSPAGAMRAHKGRKRSIRLDGRRTALGRTSPFRGETGKVCNPAQRGHTTSSLVVWRHSSETGESGPGHRHQNVRF